MKLRIIIFIILSNITLSFSQNPEASHWFIGREALTVTDESSVAVLDFSNNELQIDRREDIKGISFDFNSTSISDENGNLLFYIDGCSIYNSNHEIMEGAQTLNEGLIKNDYCSTSISYPEGYASTVILPSPKDDSIYYVIHNKIEQFWPDEYSRTYYSIINLKLNDGKGKVTEINQLILSDSTYLGEMAAIKHANNTDWWVVIPEDSNNVYNVLLLDSLGIQKSHDQVMGEKVGYYGTGSGQSCFSNDGRKFARWTITNQLLIADFNRENGQFYNYEQVEVQDSISRGGVCFSPNNRFLYVSSGYHLDQFDMKDSNWVESQVTIAEWDGFRDFVRTFFRRMQLTPDCRIFISSPGGHRYWHVIQNPNERGLACNLEQHALLLPTRTFNTLPYFPNYSLGPIGNEGYPCDSTKTKVTYNSIDIPLVQIQQPTIFPNPSNGIIRIDLPHHIGELNFELFDMAGKFIFTKKSVFPFEEIQLTDAANGMYFYKLIDKKGQLWSGKVVVNR